MILSNEAIFEYEPFIFSRTLGHSHPPSFSLLHINLSFSPLLTSLGFALFRARVSLLLSLPLMTSPTVILSDTPVTRYSLTPLCYLLPRTALSLFSLSLSSHVLSSLVFLRPISTSLSLIVYKNRCGKENLFYFYL